MLTTIQITNEQKNEFDLIKAQLKIEKKITLITNIQLFQHLLDNYKESRHQPEPE